MSKIYRNPLVNIKPSLHISNKVQEKGDGSGGSVNPPPSLNRLHQGTTANIDIILQFHQISLQILAENSEKAADHCISKAFLMSAHLDYRSKFV